MATTQQDATLTPSGGATEELRAEMYRILDELASGRSDRASTLQAKFDTLWKQIGAGEDTRTVH
jgi:hypothetical protein